MYVILYRQLPRNFPKASSFLVETSSFFHYFHEQENKNNTIQNFHGKCGNINLIFLLLCHQTPNCLPPLPMLSLPTCHRPGHTLLRPPSRGARARATCRPCSGRPGTYPPGEVSSSTWMLGRGRVHLAIGVAVAVAIVGSAMAKAMRSDLGNEIENECEYKKQFYI